MDMASNPRGFGRFSFSLTAPNIESSIHFALHSTNENTRTLLKAWRRDPKTPLAMEHIIRNGYEGLQISSVDGKGTVQIEGIAQYAVKSYGIYLRALETAPWNRIDRRIRGIAGVLVAGLALESEQKGYGGRVFTIPTNPAAEKFNRRCGFLSFRQFAKKTGLARSNYPPGYPCCMVLDGRGAQALVARQLACRGNLTVDINIPSLVSLPAS